MNNEQSSTHKGCAITTRSTEVLLPSGWGELAALPSTWTHHFMAGFSVTPSGRATASWQQFPAARFDTRVLAASNALCEARRSIDRKLAEP